MKRVSFKYTDKPFLILDDEFRSWGVCDFAYIKKDFQKNIWIIYSADGKKLGSTQNKDVAVASAIQSDLTPMFVN